MIHMPLQWQHINKCNKNCRKVDILTSNLVHLNSSTPNYSLTTIVKPLMTPTTICATSVVAHMTIFKTISPIIIIYFSCNNGKFPHVPKNESHVKHLIVNLKNLIFFKMVNCHVSPYNIIVAIIMHILNISNLF
jgi:hypothetical protein